MLRYLSLIALSLTLIWKLISLFSFHLVICQALFDLLSIFVNILFAYSWHSLFLVGLHTLLEHPRIHLSTICKIPYMDFSIFVHLRQLYLLGLQQLDEWEISYYNLNLSNMQSQHPHTSSNEQLNPVNFYLVLFLHQPLLLIASFAFP